MKAMKNLSLILFLLIYCAGIFSCSDSDNDGYSGKNKLYITTDQDPVMIESDTTPLRASLIMTRAYAKDQTFEISVTNTTNEMENLVTVKPSSVTIPSGAKAVNFDIISNGREILKNEVYLEISVKALPETDMEVHQILKIRLKPGLRNPELSEEQKALLESYKQNGLDLSQWIGVIPVKVKINSPADGSYEPFITEFTKEYTGKTVITLSEQSTANAPVLKMTENPMGLTEYFYFILRKVTVENTEYWTPQPDVPAMMELINFSADSKETFDMTLDNIRLGMPQNGKSAITFTGEKSEDDPITIVPFHYDYSAWNRLKELADAGNEIALACSGNSQTLDPLFHLFTTDISEDGWENEPSDFVAPEGNLNINEGKMTFIFSFDHSDAGGYSQITIEYTLPE